MHTRFDLERKTEFGMVTYFGEGRFRGSAPLLIVQMSRGLSAIAEFLVKVYKGYSYAQDLTMRHETKLYIMAAIYCCCCVVFKFAMR